MKPCTELLINYDNSHWTQTTLSIILYWNCRTILEQYCAKVEIVHNSGILKSVISNIYDGEKRRFFTRMAFSTSTEDLQIVTMKWREPNRTRCPIIVVIDINCNKYLCRYWITHMAILDFCGLIWWILLAYSRILNNSKVHQNS